MYSIEFLVLFLVPLFTLLQLNVAERFGFDKKELSCIHYSLALTLDDSKQFRQALYYHQKNLKLWKGNPSEVREADRCMIVCNYRGASLIWNSWTQV